MDLKLNLVQSLAYKALACLYCRIYVLHVSINPSRHSDDTLMNMHIRFPVISQRRKLKVWKFISFISLASLLWDIGKQNIPRCDAAEFGVSFGAILFAQLIVIEKLNQIQKSLPTPLKMKRYESGHTQMIQLGIR